jgi:hypothetical protein
VAIVIAAALASTTARADSSSAAMPERLRLDFVQETLEKDASSARLWYFGWSGFYAAASGTQLALALTVDDVGLRADTRVGAVTSGLGFLVTAVMPPPSLFYSPCAASDDATPASRAACLARQEQRLEDAAAVERLGHSWLAHAGGIVVNVGAGLFLWQHDNRPASGLLATIGGIAVGEFQIFTAPTRARDAGVRRGVSDARFAIAPRTGGGVLVLAIAF